MTTTTEKKPSGFDDPDNQTMPCPRCRTPHRRGPYIPLPDHARKPLGDLLKGKDGQPYPPGSKYHGMRSGTPFGPADVTCGCGAVLRHTVPIFCVDAYGWHWEIL